MTPRRALIELIEQHDELRQIMSQCELLADELDAYRIEPADLVREVTRLRVVFDAHNQFEERFLRPILREVESFGELRLEQLMSDHIGEHREMQNGLASTITGELRMTVDRLRHHLELEERYFMSSKVLRDELSAVG